MRMLVVGGGVRSAGVSVGVCESVVSCIVRMRMIIYMNIIFSGCMYYSICVSVRIKLGMRMGVKVGFRNGSGRRCSDCSGSAGSGGVGGGGVCVGRGGGGGGGGGDVVSGGSSDVVRVGRSAHSFSVCSTKIRNSLLHATKL